MDKKELNAIQKKWQHIDISHNCDIFTAVCLENQERYLLSNNFCNFNDFDKNKLMIKSAEFLKNLELKNIFHFISSLTSDDAYFFVNKKNNQLELEKHRFNCKRILFSNSVEEIIHNYYTHFFTHFNLCCRNLTSTIIPINFNYGNIIDFNRLEIDFNNYLKNLKINNNIKSIICTEKNYKIIKCFSNFNDEKNKNNEKLYKVGELVFNSNKDLKINIRTGVFQSNSSVSKEYNKINVYVTTEIEEDGILFIEDNGYEILPIDNDYKVDVKIKVLLNPTITSTILIPVEVSINGHELVYNINECTNFIDIENNVHILKFQE
jgi:hypothetical protein